MLTPKRAIMIGMIAGSLLGGWLPTLWGDSGFSIAAIVGSTFGGLAGIWAGWRYTR
jgi:outer membrane lipoprotein SlyB